MSFHRDEDGFWCSTPRQVARALKGFGEQDIRERNRAAWTVWHIGILVRVALSHKKNGKPADYPKLETMMVNAAPATKQTPEQMLAVVTMINAACGGAVTAMKV